MTATELAEIIHETWRTYDNVILRHPGPDATWAVLPGWKRDMFTAYAQLLMDGYGPETAHEVITDFMDANNYLSPLSRPWRDLSPDHQRKGMVAVSLVRNFGDYPDM